jgi:hypothetical protein
VEQRIGRLHRYGQRETVQVYNLVAEETVEERIYSILETKLLEIAQSIGKLDESGRPTEDFHYDILGYLGSRPDYQDLYKRALVDRDYKRTEKEVQRMIEEAVRAREALCALTQDFSGFNLEHFRQLEGRYELRELGEWVRDVILKLGGAVIPDGEFWTLITPDSIRQAYRLAPRYERVCFDRELAMRVRNCELGGLGHPLVDALLNEVRKPGFQGKISGVEGGGSVYAHYVVQRKSSAGHLQGRVYNFLYDPGSEEVKALRRFELCEMPGTRDKPPDVSKARDRIEAVLKSAMIEWLPDRQSRTGLQVHLVGLHFA